jgi:hypothetical protein
MTNIIQLNLFLIIFDYKMLGNKSRCKLINIRGFNYLMIVIFFRLLIGMEVLCMCKRMCINRLHIKNTILLKVGHLVADRLSRWKWNKDLDTTIRYFWKIQDVLQFN